MDSRIKKFTQTSPTRTIKHLSYRQKKQIEKASNQGKQVTKAMERPKHGSARLADTLSSRQWDRGRVINVPIFHLDW